MTNPSLNDYRKHAQHAPEYGASRIAWKPDAEEDRATVAFVGVVVFWFVVGVVFALANVWGL